jgi:predicted secreted acid phosphatase
MTNRPAPALLGALAALVVAAPAAAQLPTHRAEPPAIREFRDSGKWERNVVRVAKQAKARLKARTTSRRAPRKPAVVLDIDDTSIDLYPCLEAGNFGFGTGDFADFPGLYASCVVQTHTPVKPIRSLFKRARALRVSVFFVTARPEGIRGLTLDQLKKAGYRGRYQLVMQPNGYAKRSKVPYKSGARRKIERRGFTILANVGDQKSDLKGGYAEKTYLIENLMYRTP